MKTARIRKLTIEFLKKKRKASTSDILEYLNKRLKHGTTQHALGNILGKDHNFKQLGTDYSMNCQDKQYPTAIWGLRNNAISTEKG